MAIWDEPFFLPKKEVFYECVGVNKFNIALWMTKPFVINPVTQTINKQGMMPILVLRSYRNVEDIPEHLEYKSDHEIFITHHTRIVEIFINPPPIKEVG